MQFRLDWKRRELAQEHVECENSMMQVIRSENLKDHRSAVNGRDSCGGYCARRGTDLGPIRTIDDAPYKRVLKSMIDQ